MAKMVFTKAYAHRSGIDTLPDWAKDIWDRAEKWHSVSSNMTWNVFKCDKKRPGAYTLLWYCDFETEAHPELRRSERFDFFGTRHATSYKDSENPFILHRKEMLVYPDHPQIQRWAALTAEEEKAGLFDKEHVSKIGRKKYWEDLLARKGYRILFGVLVDVKGVHDATNMLVNVGHDAQYLDGVDHGWEQAFYNSFSE